MSRSISLAPPTSINGKFNHGPANSLKSDASEARDDLRDEARLDVAVPRRCTCRCKKFKADNLLCQPPGLDVCVCSSSCDNGDRSRSFFNLFLLVQPVQWEKQALFIFVCAIHCVRYLMRYLLHLFICTLKILSTNFVWCGRLCLLASRFVSTKQFPVPFVLGIVFWIWHPSALAVAWNCRFLRRGRVRVWPMRAKYRDNGFCCQTRLVDWTRRGQPYSVLVSPMEDPVRLENQTLAKSVWIALHVDHIYDSKKKKQIVRIV